MSEIPTAAHAIPLLALLLAVGATAQTGTVVVDRSIYATTSTGVYVDDLDAERLDLQDALRAYQADARAYDAEAARVRAAYDRLARYGGSRAERDAYDDALFRLEDESRRLEGEAAMLNDWTADLSARLLQRGQRPPTARTLEIQRRIAERRIAEQRLTEEYLREHQTRHRRTHTRRAHTHTTRTRGHR